MLVLIIWIKFKNRLLNAEYNQEVTLPSSRLLFGKLSSDKMVFNMLVPLYGTIYPYLLKTTVLNTFKHNLKKTISWQFSWKLGLVGLFLVFTYIFYPFVYWLIGPSIYLFTYFFLFHSFSHLFSTFILPIYHFLYLASQSIFYCLLFIHSVISLYS